MADTAKNTEEFANSIGIGVNRFEELSSLVAVVLKHNEDALWSAVMRQCIMFGKNAMEVMLIGMMLGRVMQESLCDQCINDAAHPVMMLVLRKPATVDPNHKP